MITVLFNIDIPMNCSKILSEILSLANLDLIEVDDYISAIFDFQLESKPFNENFEDAGIQSTTFLVELGMLFFVIMISLFTALCKLICRKCTEGCEVNCLTKVLRKKVNSLVVLVRFFMEYCYEMGLASLMALKMSGNDQRWSRLPESLDLILAWVAAILLVCTPFIVYYYGRRLVNNPNTMSETLRE